MIVIADTGPINYLISIGHVNILPKLYQTVLIPFAVRDELRDAGAPDLVRRWIDSPPAWLEINNWLFRPMLSFCASASGGANGTPFFLRRKREPTTYYLTIKWGAERLSAVSFIPSAPSEYSGLHPERAFST